MRVSATKKARRVRASLEREETSRTLEEPPTHQAYADSPLHRLDRGDTILLHPQRKRLKELGVESQARDVMSQSGGAASRCNVSFSNRPFGVKRFQTNHHHSVDVARGLALLFGIGTKALPSWDSRTRWNNLWVGLVVSVTAGPSGHANSPHPSSRKGHHSTVQWSSSFLLSGLILYGSHAVAASLVHRNSVPSTHMRCMITASLRASATIAFFIPRRLAICIAQALSHDHFFERSML